MKKIFNFKRKKGSPSPSETASVLSASYDVKEKDLGKVHKAAFKGDVTKLRQLAKKSDLNQLDKENRTPLHIACSCGHTDVVHFLVESKVKLNLCDNQNRSALMKAVQCEMERSVSMLLEHEADPNLVDINGNTALHLAARIPSSFIVLQLLEHSACINAQNKDGNTALMLAVMENHTDMSELLLKEGADVNIQNVEQRSALMMAACQGQISMVRLLLRYHADITVKDDKGWSSEDYAVMNGHHACSHLIIEHGTKRESLQSPSHVGKKKETSMIRSAAGEAGLPFKAPAVDKDDTEDNSHTDSISRASRSGAADSWSSSDEELDFSIKRKTENVKKPIKLTLGNKEAVADEDEDKSWNTSEMNSEEKCETHTGLSRTLLPLEPLPQSLPSPASLPPPIQRTSIFFSSSLKKEEAREKNSPKELHKRPSSENKRDTEDNSHTDSISRASRSGAADSWPSSDELDFNIKRKTENVKKPIKLTLDNKEAVADEDEGKSWNETEMNSEEKCETLTGLSRTLLPHGPSTQSLPSPASLPPPIQRTSIAFSSSLKEGNPVGSRDEEMTEKIPEEPHEKPSLPERDFLSELGLEKDEDHDSPWDSESESGSHRIIHSSAVNTPTKATRAASSVCDEDVLYVPSFVRGGRKLNIMRSVGQPGGHRPSGIKKKEDGEEHKESSEAATATPKMKEEERVPSGLMDSREVKKNSSQAEDLRLAVADDQEDLDSVGSISRPPSPLRDDYVSETTKAPTPTSVPLPSPRFIPSDPKPHPLPRLRSDSNLRPESSESDWDTDASSPARRTEKPDVTKPEPDPQDDMADDAVDQAGKQREESMRGDQRSSALWDGEGLREASQLKDESIPSNTKLGDERNLQTRSLRSSAANCPVKAAADKSQRNVGRASSPEEQDHRPSCRRNQELDDGTLSDLSEDGRSPSSRRKKEAGSRDVEVQDDLGDLTQSSDTATEELDTSGSGFRNASMLFKQLDTRYLDSVSVVKLQNMFHEYERTIQRGRDRHSRLADKNSQLERERSEQKTLLEEIRSTVSDLEHRNLELETDLNTLKFLLRQEQEKHQTAQILYNKTREQLQRKEEQQRCEAEERHKAEQMVRNLELDVRALRNSIKQLEEDRDESQRLLSHERSARSLQEELLSNHLRKQQDIEEENLRQLSKSNEVTFHLSEASEREREFLQQKRVLQDKLLAAQAELDRSQNQSQQEETRLAEEREVLRERLEDARRDLKLNEEALTQTVFQYNALKAEFSVATAKLEHERQMRQQLEGEVEASRARLQVALQEAERCQASRAEAERLLQRGREEHQRSQEKLQVESSLQRDTVQSLSQKLSKAEARANSLENECHRGALTAAETGVLLESLAREKDQAQVKLKELESWLQSEREQVARAAAKQEAMLERLALAQSEGALLRQQLEEALSKDSAKDKAVTHVQHNFAEMLNQLRADGEKRVHLVEERSSELARSNSDLRDQNCKLEQEKTDREVSLRKLQQELADCLKKLSMCEASLEVNTRYRHDLEEDKSRALKDLDRLKAKLQESEEVQVQAERRISQMKSSLDEQQRESCSTAQKLQEALAGAAAQALTVKQLEEAVQRLEIENARLEATSKQQSGRVEALQKSVQDAAAVRNRLEDLVTNLQSSKMSLEEQLNREMQKQSTLSHNVQDSQSLWEEELKNRSRLGLRLSELEKEKGELTNQMVLEKKKANKLVDQKKSVDSRLEQEINRNTELQKEMYRLRTLLKTAKRQLRESGGGQLSSPASSFRGLETDGTISRMKIRVDELQTQYEREASRCSRLEEANRQLKDKLTSGRSREQMDGRRKQLEEEVKVLRRQLESGVMDHTQAELFRRDTEERARQEIRHKLEEVNIFLQTQAASQDALEQMKAANEASQRSQLEQRIRDLEAELSRLRGAQQDSAALRNSSRAELERYKQLYGDELRLRKSLASKLERSSERLAEANTKLLSERRRSKSLLSSGVVSGVLGPLDVGSLGSTGTFGASLGPLNRSLSFATPRLGTVGDSPSTCVEAYIAKMQTELGKNILKELDHKPGELDGGSARLSPVGSASNSPNLQIGSAVDLSDPVLRATQQYLEVLKKNHKI